jgi:hypothetical protein
MNPTQTATVIAALKEIAALDKFGGYNSACGIAREALALLTAPRPADTGGEGVRSAARDVCDALLDMDHSRGCQGREYACTCDYDDTVHNLATGLRGALAQPPSEAAPDAPSQAAQVVEGNARDYYRGILSKIANYNEVDWDDNKTVILAFDTVRQIARAGFQSEPPSPAKPAPSLCEEDNEAEVRAALRNLNDGVSE